MARIAYSMSGEGRGHATRVEAVVSMLSQHHDLLVYAPPLAYHLLSESLQENSRVELRRLDGLQFRYSGKRLSYLKSVVASVPFLMSLHSRVATMRRELTEWGATHAICDFEPTLSRAVCKLNIPLISLDHQHFLTTIQPESLPWTLRWKVRALAPSVALFCPGPMRQIVSAYFDFPLRQNLANVDRVGALMRNCVLQAKSEWGEHVVAYFRRNIPESVLNALATTGRAVHVYGLGARPRLGNIRFQSTSVQPFLEHLRSCRALVTSAGNQLVGEALYLRKPVLAIPEQGNFEQSLNAHFLPRTNGGETTTAHRCTPRFMQMFLEKGPEMRDAIAFESVAGNRATENLLHEMFGTSATATEDPAQEIAA